MKVKTHKFNGVRYNIVLSGKTCGLCESPYDADAKPHIRIFRDINTKEGLITLLHECLHADGWAISEDVVDRVSEDIGSLLWRVGYRRKKK